MRSRIGPFFCNIYIVKIIVNPRKGSSMAKTNLEILQSKLDAENYQKAAVLDNEKLFAFLADAVTLCEPESVWVSTDSTDDVAYTREMAKKLAEEKPLAIEGHTIHFDGMSDQGRDRKVTRYLVPKTETLSKALNQMERQAGLSEIRCLIQGSMK